MKTLTKSDLAVMLQHCDRTLFPGKEGAIAANRVIDILKQAIYARGTIYIPRVCRLNVTVKSPRIGRNPKTGKPHEIVARHSVTASNSNKGIATHKLNKTALIEQLSVYYTISLSKTIAETFYMFMDRVTPTTRIEIRGFGVFYNRHRPASTRRNPKTGELVQTKDVNLIKFRLSDSLRKSMDTHYLT